MSIAWTRLCGAIALAISFWQEEKRERDAARQAEATPDPAG